MMNQSYKNLGDGRVAAVICMPEFGHFQGLRSIIQHLAGSGFRVVALTHSDYATQVKEAGGEFLDLFSLASVNSADASSIPIPCRYVSYAACFADLVASELKKINASLVVADAFAVVGAVAARELQIPYVTVCVGHNMNPRRHLRLLQSDDRRLSISDSCHQAVEVLRNKYGIKNASVFSFVTTLSPFLNICCEPEQFLTPTDRSVFEPAAFFGSVYQSTDQLAATQQTRYFDARTPTGINVYVSFGTVVWRYFGQQAIDAVNAIAYAVAKRPRTKAVISLGGSILPPDLLAFRNEPSVMLHDFVDQHHALTESDIFVTHHGLNSTHEAIFNKVPMLSNPFFADQPALAAKCQELGVALPISRSSLERLRPEQVRLAIDRFCDCRDQIAARLETAHNWELDVIRNRPEVVKQVAQLG